MQLSLFNGHIYLCIQCFKNIISAYVGCKKMNSFNIIVGRRAIEMFISLKVPRPCPLILLVSERVKD
jgi:hypothetical protein